VRERISVEVANDDNNDTRAIMQNNYCGRDS